MKAEEKEKLKKHIAEKMKMLKEDIQSYGELVKPVSPDNSIGRLTRMDAINSKNVNEEALRRAKETLHGLERAVREMDDQDFGICESCEEEIPFARLMVMPETVLCVSCASKVS